MKAEFTKFGPKHDYRGAHVTLDWQGRTLLGTIRCLWRDDARGVTLVTVRHFNGDTWPVTPALGALTILEHT